MKYKLKFGIIAIAEYDNCRGAMSAEIDMLSPSASQNRTGTNDGFCITEMLSKFKERAFYVGYSFRWRSLCKDRSYISS